MAKQVGPIWFRGSIGNLNYFKTADGYEVRLKGGVDKERILNDPAFKRTRENMQEFAHAARAAKILRKAMRQSLDLAKDRTTNRRTTTAMFKVVRSDTTSIRGARNVFDGNLTLLKDFEFNINCQVFELLITNYSADYDRPTGKATAVFEAFNPNRHMKPPSGATHFKMFASACEVNFNGLDSVATIEFSNMEQIGLVDIPKTTVEVDLTPASQLPVVVTMGFEFYQRRNGFDYILDNGQFNACTIQHVSVI